MPEPDEIRPAEAAADPAPAAPPSFGHDEPARPAGELRIPTAFRLQAPWWAAESTDTDEPDPEPPSSPPHQAEATPAPAPTYDPAPAPTGPATQPRPEAPVPHAEAAADPASPPHADGPEPTAPHPAEAPDQAAPLHASAAGPGAGSAAGNRRVPEPEDRLVAGAGAPDVDSRRAVPRPKPTSRPARDTVPDGTPIQPPAASQPEQAASTGPRPLPSAQSDGTGPQPLPSAQPSAGGQAADGTGPQALPPVPSADGTGPQPTVAEPRPAITPPPAPQAAPAAGLEARTDSRTSGPVLTPDAILPPGVTLPPAVALPTVERNVEQTVHDVPRQNAPVTVTDMPTVPQRPATGGATATAVAPVQPPPLRPDGPNDGNTGPQPVFPAGPLNSGPGSKASRRKRLLIGGGVAAAVLAVGGIAVAGIVSSDGGGKTTKHKTRPVAGGSPSPSAPVHHPVDINDEKTDTRPLALTEVFPSPAIQLGGQNFQRDRSSVNHQCGLTARGSMAAALAHEGCRAVVRVTFVSDSKKFAVTSGVAVLPTHDAAVKVSRSGNPGRYEWFRGLTGPHSPDIDGTGGYAAATVRGRYVAYAYATYTDGTRITPQDTQIKGLAQQFLDYGTKALDARARG
ncbi:hypothetical protein [Actinomadura rupiterrae]|uniref:hypothetical protein n=1 Tax=Actinomadura rupiterrae TaxID=559627 RepID=UPI0020A4F8B3|nr:hypothetical protein [Actinomadura rupiterrae]MCP2343298.1 hypothetical protein [Actinomadura rupiterrae]